MEFAILFQKISETCDLQSMSLTTTWQLRPQNQNKISIPIWRFHVIHAIIKEPTNFWWLVRVTLVVAWWLFAPEFWEVVGTYESLFCSKMNAASVVVTCEVVGTLNHYKMVKKNLNLAHLEVVGM